MELEVDENATDHFKITGFDAELARRAEKFSDKWVQLYKHSTQNDDNLSGIIETTAIGGHNINRFDKHNPFEQHLNSHPESIIERNKLILLDRKYFKFETSSSNDDNDDAETSNTSDTDDIKKYATVFNHSDEHIEDDPELDTLPIVQIHERKAEQKTDNCRIQGKTETKSTKKKKGRTKYRPLAYDEVTTASTSASNTRGMQALAAPPGVKVLKSPLRHPRQMDLSKNGICSLQFRL